MGWFNRNGIWFLIKGGGASDVDPNYLRMAQNDLELLKAYTPDLEVRHFNRPGMWRITSTFGRDEIHIEPRLVAPPRPPKKRVIERASRIKLVPAFHTYDGAYNWLGITLCLSGKWGPPYQFIPIEQEKIYDFDWGCWNFGSPSDEPPQDYVKRMIKTGNDGEFYLLSEVPAAHQYAGEDYWTHSEPYHCYDFIGEWASDPYSQTVIWEAPYAGTLVLRKVEWHSLVHETTTVRLLAAGVDVGPSTSGIDEDYIEETSILRAYGGEQSKSISRAKRFVDEYFGSEWEEWTQVCLTPCISYQFDEWYWKALHSSSGASLWSPGGHSTFDGQATTDGCIVYAIDNYAINSYREFQNHYIDYAHFPDHPDEEWQNYTYSVNEWATDHIMVFGQNYHLGSFGSAYYDSDGHVEWAAPRIYRLRPDGPLEYCFCAMQKSPGYYHYTSYEQAWWEYLAFTPEHEQYNDPEVRFQVVNPTAGWPFLHEIPDVETPDGQKCYGNGEYSLIEMFYPEAVSIEVEF